MHFSAANVCCYLAPSGLRMEGGGGGGGILLPVEAVFLSSSCAQCQGGGSAPVPALLAALCPPCINLLLRTADFCLHKLPA